MTRSDLEVLAFLANEKARDFAYSKSPAEAGWRHRDAISSRFFNGDKTRADRTLIRLKISGDVETRPYWVSFPQPQPDGASGVGILQHRAIRAQAYAD